MSGTVVTCLKYRLHNELNDITYSKWKILCISHVIVTINLSSIQLWEVSLIPDSSSCGIGAGSHGKCHMMTFYI